MANSTFTKTITQYMGRASVIRMNQLDGRERLRALVGRVEMATRYGHVSDIRFDAACYALSLALVSGRLNGTAYAKITAMSVSEMLNLVSSLVEENVYTGGYGEYLNRKFLREEEEIA